MTTHGQSSESRWAQIQRDLGHRLSKRLFEELSTDPHSIHERRSNGFPRFSLSIAYVMAVLVYGLSLMFGLLGLALIMPPWNTIFDPMLAAVFMLLCWAARPRIVAPPYYMLSRTEFPTLYALSDRIANFLRTRPVRGIAYSADFGANYREAGFANRPYIELGAPLLAILENDQRLAVLAHELSHGANGDPLRSGFLSGAVNTLAAWGTSFRPEAIGSIGKDLPYGGIVSLLGIPFDVFMLALSELTLLAAKAFLLLVLRQSQRAEYLADRLAASVAGSKEMQEALEKTYFDKIVDHALRVHALTAPYEPIGSKILQAANAVMSIEVEALRSESLSLQWQVDSTHPPTALRVGLLELNPALPLPGLLSKTESDALTHEVNRILALSEREMINRQLEAISG